MSEANETVESTPVHPGCYTPGPWVVDEHVLHSAGHQVYAEHGNGHLVATLLTEYSPDHQKANAHLISAAPELLEACRLAIDVIGDRLCTNKMQAAIDKATKVL